MELYARVYHSLFTGWNWSISDEHDRIVAKGDAKTVMDAAAACNRAFIDLIVCPPVRNPRTEVFSPDSPRNKARVQVDVWRHEGNLYGMAVYAAPRSRAMVLRKYTDAQAAWADMRQVAADLLG